jgi:hypothetical protein
MTLSHRPLVELPVTVTPPTPDDVETSAKASPIVATLSKLRDYLGPDGRTLSKAGGLTFDNAPLVADILGLRLITDPALPGTEDGPLWADPEPRCALTVEVAIECGAIHQIGRRLVPVASWDTESVVVQASVALSTVIELGPLWTSMDRGDRNFDVRDATLDAACVSWMATLLPDNRQQRVDHFVNWGTDLCREQLGGDPFVRPGELDMWVDNATCYLIDTLAWAGAVDWIAPQLVRPELEPEHLWLGGGSIRLTALGRHVLPDHLADHGYRLRQPDTSGTRPAETLLGDVLVAPDEEAGRALVAAWRPDLDDAERARLVTAVLLEADYAPWRLSGFEVLEMIGPEVAAPYVRQLLDSPSSEAAAQFLVLHGLADREELAPFLGYGPLIDALASVVNRPDLLRTSLLRLLEAAEAPELLLEVIALYPTPEATMVLTAAARHVTDPRYSDLLRAAEQYHLDVMTERDVAS